MAIEDSFSIVGGIPNITQVRDYITTFLRRVLVTVVGITWLIFWGLVTRLHVETGDFVSAGVVGVLFGLPALGGLVYYFRDSLTRD